MISDMELMVLKDCSISTNQGYIDQGSPSKMARLAALGLVTKVGNGHQCTPEGYAFLKSPQVKERLGGAKRKKRDDEEGLRRDSD